MANLHTSPGPGGRVVPIGTDAMRAHERAVDSAVDEASNQLDTPEDAVRELLGGFDRAIDKLPASEVRWRGMLLRVRAALAQQAGLPPFGP